MLRLAFKVIAILALIIIPTATFIWLQPDVPAEATRSFREVSSPPSAPLSPLILSLVMLVGIVFGAANTEIRNLSKVEFPAVFRNIFQSPGLWRSILAAPIVFSGVYAAGGANASDAIIGALFAFQNGFFCEAILREREKKPDAPAG